MDLGLFNRLNKNDIIPVILQEISPDEINMHLISTTGSYTVATTSIIKGSLPKSILTLSVRMDTVSALLNRGHAMQIAYEKGKLVFYCNKGASNELKLTPVSVESLDDSTIEVIRKIDRLDKFLGESKSANNEIAELENKIANLKESKDKLKLLCLSGGFDSSPFGDTVEDQFDSKYEDTYSEYVERLNVLKSNFDMPKEIDLSDLRDIAWGAARYNRMVDLCGSFASVNLVHGFLLYKGTCPIGALSGSLIQNLIKASGKVYEFEGELVFVGENGITVFIHKYLPNTDIDFNIVDRDKMLEYYKVNCGEGLMIQLNLLSKFPSITMDMGAGIIIAESSISETLEHKMKINEFKSVQLNRLKDNPNLAPALSLARFTIPQSIVRVMSLFTGDIEIAVKKSRIIIKKGKLYLVFGRQLNEQET